MVNLTTQQARTVVMIEEYFEKRPVFELILERLNGVGKKSFPNKVSKASKTIDV